MAGGRREPLVRPLTENADARVLRVLLRFRLGLTVVAAAPFLLGRSPGSSRGLQVLTVLVIVMAAVAAAGPYMYRRYGVLLIESAGLPVLVLAAALLDHRTVGTVPLPQPLDGFAIGTVALVAYLRGWRWSALVGGATIGVELAAAVAQVGVGLSTVTLLSQRATWLVAAAAMASFVRATVGQASSAEREAGKSEERLRQHRALHDRSVQTLTAVVRGAPSWSRVRADAAEEAARLQDLDRTSPAEGLVDALRTSIARRSASLPARLVVHGLPQIPSDVTEAIRGAVDEALTNVEKHAAAAPTVVTVDGGTDWVAVDVKDTGPGSPDHGAGGFGVRHSIHGRMAAVDGTATIGSPEGTGTTVTLSWARHAPPPSRWRGPGAWLPWPTTARIVAAIVAWQCAASLSILVVAGHRQWVSRLAMAASACLLPAVLGILVVNERAASRVRGALHTVPLLFGVPLPVAGAVLAQPRHLLMDFADPFTPSATGATAVVALVGGPIAGGVAFVATGVAAVLIAPLLNGYTLSELGVINTIERLVIMAGGFYMALAIGRVVAVDVRQQRWAAITNARVSEAAAIGTRLVDTLRAIAAAPANSMELRRRAYIALAWARHRLSGANMPSAEQVILVVAEAAARHVDTMSRAPQILGLHRLPSPDVLERLGHVLDVAVEDIASCSAPVTITVRGDPTSVRVVITRSSGSAPAGGLLEQMTRLLASVGGDARLSRSAGSGFRLELSVPTAENDVSIAYLDAVSSAE